MNRDEVKQILSVYRPGTADAQDPEIVEALALVKSDPELSQWLEEHCARQNALREKFRKISIPPALKEQIISEQAARAKNASRREKIVGVVAVAAIAVSLVVIVAINMPHKPRTIANTLANYQSQMVSSALNPYYMHLTTNATEVQSFLAQKQAPSDYVLPAGLRNVTITGCAVAGWQNSQASMICFRTGKPLPPGRQSDLWLFVIDLAGVKNVSPIAPPQYAQVNGLITATWTQDNKLYMLGTQGDEQTIQKYL